MIICDRCKKNIEPSKTFFKTYFYRVTNFDEIYIGNQVIAKEDLMDMCEKCVHEINQFIDNKPKDCWVDYEQRG